MEESKKLPPPYEELRAELERLKVVGYYLINDAQSDVRSAREERDRLRNELSTVTKQYTQLKDATWNIPGAVVPSDDNDCMTHEETLRQAVDQSRSHESVEEMIDDISDLEKEVAKLRKVAGELYAALEKAVEYVQPEVSDLLKAYSGKLSADMVCNRIRQQKATLESVLVAAKPLLEEKPS